MSYFTLLYFTRRCMWDFFKRYESNIWLIIIENRSIDDYT